VLIGCGAAVIGGMGAGATSIDILGIATAFGLAIIAMAYGIGQVSGCHINPAVSFGVLVAGRLGTARGLDMNLDKGSASAGSSCDK
jgi:aquaporin Z